MITPKQFQTQLLRWFDQHGRKHLPWQQDKTPYRIWVSEIMLQQTQVQTVIPYFLRFMKQFPTLNMLANADEESVLHLWAGLGYYSRARNLYRAAKKIMHEWNGKFPDTLHELEQLPGIGLSTAGAIFSIAFNQPAAILDGNVKRVLTRLHGITKPINQKMIENQLWALAKQYTPQKRAADYTQAMMDLGATLCRRTQPQCTHCPFNQQCYAKLHAMTANLPQKQRTRTIPTRTTTFVIFKKGNAILLQKRPSKGIWGGLWSLPEIKGEPDENTIRTFCLDHFQMKIKTYHSLTAFKHSFTHFHLMIFPIMITLRENKSFMATAEQIWYNLSQPEKIGLPKPIQTIVSDLS